MAAYCGHMAFCHVLLPDMGPAGERDFFLLFSPSSPEKRLLFRLTPPFDGGIVFNTKVVMKGTASVFAAQRGRVTG